MILYELKLRYRKTTQPLLAMKKIELVSFLCLILVFGLSIDRAYGQEYKYEIGPIGGASFYMGDANRTKLFLNMGPAVGLMHRYNMSLNWSVKSNLVVGQVSGNTKYSDNVFPNGNETSFKRNFIDVGAQIEYNLFRYSDQFSYLNTRGYTPYLFSGVGLTVASGESVFVNANIPIGIGVKYKIRNKLNIGLEFSMRKLFGDDFDVTEKSDNWNLDSPFGIKSSFIKNKDWYSLTMLFISWEFGEKYNPCCD